jgi:hypothetical protein
MQFKNKAIESTSEKVNRTIFCSKKYEEIKIVYCYNLSKVSQNIILHVETIFGCYLPSFAV